MYNIIVNEFIKIKSSKYFYLSILMISLPALVSFLVLSLTSHQFIVGDINYINITLLAFVGSRTIFPMLSMTLIKIEYDSFGFESLFITPLNRFKVVLSKLITSFIWMLLLIVISISFIIVSELLFFKDLSIFIIIKNSLKNYFYIMIYTLPIQIFAMTLTFAIRRMLMPVLLLSFYIILEYMIHMSNKIAATPAIITEFIINNLTINSSIVLAFAANGLFGILSLILLKYLVENKEFI